MSYLDRLPSNPVPPALPADVGLELRRAIGHRPLHLFVLVLADGEARIETRKLLAASLRFAGSYELGRKIRSAAVPIGHVLTYVDSERGTNVTSVDADEFLGPLIEEAETRPSCLLSAGEGDQR